METVWIVLVVILFIVLVVSVMILLRQQFRWEARWRDRETQWKEQMARRLEEEREEAIKASRAVLGGKFTEHLAPYLPGFEYDPTEARFIGYPIDLIVFPGLSKKSPEKVVFIEIKTGKSSLTTPQRKIRDLIKNGVVAWEEIRLPGVKDMREPGEEIEEKD